jgi:signal transduction protein with GAF and PtsI domain
MLWGAAGLVATGGNANAHLIEVADSLGVPAVVGCNLGNVPENALVAVGGESGEVWML